MRGSSMDNTISPIIQVIVMKTKACKSNGGRFLPKSLKSPLRGSGGFGGGDWSSSSGKESELQSTLPGRSSNKLPSDDFETRLRHGADNKASTLNEQLK